MPFTRDRAVLAVGMGRAFRRTELAAIHVVHVTFTLLRLRNLVPHSKAGQEGAARWWRVPTAGALRR